MWLDFLPTLLINALTSKGSDEMAMHGYYDDDDYEGWYCVRSVKPDYSAVEVTDVFPSTKDALLDQEQITRHAQLIGYSSNLYGGGVSRWPGTNQSYVSPRHNIGYTPSLISPQPARFVVPTNGGYFNPPNGSFLSGPGEFRLTLGSKVQDYEVDSWAYFASTGVDLFDCGRRVKQSWQGTDHTFIMHKYRVKLREGVDLGHLQFFQTALSGAESTQRTYPYGSLLNYFIWREGSHSKPSGRPPVVSVMPSIRQTYVVVQPGQVLQLVFPKSFDVEVVEKLAGGALRSISRTQSALDRYACYYYKIGADLVDSFPIFFSTSDTMRQGVVLIPPIEKVGDSRYAVLHSPLDRLAIHPGEIDGLIFRLMEDDLQTNRMYLDQQSRLRVESGHRLVSATYGAPQKHVVYDLRVRITDKTLKSFEIDHLYDNATTTAIEAS